MRDLDEVITGLREAIQTGDYPGWLDAEAWDWYAELHRTGDFRGLELHELLLQVQGRLHPDDYLRTTRDN